MPTQQEIQHTQGTRLDETPPWMTYAAEMEEKLSDTLADAVAAYAERVHADNKTSSQNQEALHQQKELSNEVAKEYQWLTPEEYEDLAPRIGRVMGHDEFITLLRKAGVVCHYRQHPQDQKAVLYAVKNGVEEALCWVQIGLMPELSIMNFDEHGAPLDERRRGWRTCLLQILLKGILTGEAADKYFGRPKETQAFHRYNATLQAFRNAGGSLGEN